MQNRHRQCLPLILVCHLLVFEVYNPFCGFDSGASHYVSPNLSSFISLSPKSFLSFSTTDGIPMLIAGNGSINTHNLFFHDIYHIASHTLNLVPVSQICESGY